MKLIAGSLFMTANINMKTDRKFAVEHLRKL